MLKIRSIFVAAAVAMVSTGAHAGFYFEPRVGYHTGTHEEATLFDDFTMTTNSYKTSGVGVGAMIGYQFKTFSLGIEGMSTNFTNEDKLTKVETDLKAQDMGFFLRWDLGRFHISTAFYTSKATDESLKNSGLIEDVSGSGMRFGIGYRIFKHISINVDYVAVDYKKLNETSILAYGADRTTTLVGLSFPFGLDGK